MKTLNTIQTFSKIGKIFCKVINICCIVGIVGCVVGIIAMAFGSNVLKIGGVTLHSLMETEAEIKMETVYSSIAEGIIFCIGEFFASRMAYRYFANELKVGTPFTFDGAKELLHLGISLIWIPLVSTLAARIAIEIIGQFTESIEALDADNFESIAIGITFIFVSFLCRYGAELSTEKGETKDEEKV